MRGETGVGRNLLLFYVLLIHLFDRILGYPRVRKNLMHLNSLCWINDEHLLNQILALVRNEVDNSFWKGVGSLDDLVSDLVSIFRVKGKLSSH